MQDQLQQKSVELEDQKETSHKSSQQSMDLVTDVTRLKRTVADLEANLESHSQQNENHQTHSSAVNNQLEEVRKTLYQTQVKLQEKSSEVQKWKQAASEAQQDCVYVYIPKSNGF